MTTHLCYTQDQVHTPYDYIFYRFLYQLAWIAKFSLCSPSALLHLPSYIFPLPSPLLHLPPSDISPQNIGSLLMIIELLNHSKKLAKTFVVSKIIPIFAKE